MLRRFIDDCEGQDLIEYGLLLAIVALGAVAALAGLRNVIANVWTSISNNLAG